MVGVFGNMDEGGGGTFGVHAECVSLAKGDCESDERSLYPNPILDIGHFASDYIPHLFR